MRLVRTRREEVTVDPLSLHFSLIKEKFVYWRSFMRFRVALKLTDLLKVGFFLTLFTKKIKIKTKKKYAFSLLIVFLILHTDVAVNKIQQ